MLLGDSITAQHRYTRLVEDIVISRYPNMRIDFYITQASAGIQCLAVTQGDIQTRLKRDVLPWHPTVVSIMLGMNDGRYTTEFDKTLRRTRPAIAH